MSNNRRCPQCGEIGPRSERCSCGASRWGSGKKAVNGAAHHKTKWADGQFVAIDSEGITIEGGQHVLSLVAASDGCVLRTDEPNKGIRSYKIFNFLLSLAERHKTDTFVIFSGGYDFNMWLKDLPEEEVKELWKNRDKKNNYTSVMGGRYEISMLPRKFIKIREYERGPRWKPDLKKDGTPITHKGTTKAVFRRNIKRSIVIWDVFSFFGKSFVATAKEYGVEGYAEIEQMKALRGEFDAEMAAKVEEDCLKECQMLVEIMKKLKVSIDAAGMKVSRWDGPGALAASLLKTHKIKSHMQESPVEVFEAARSAYAGGHVEQIQYGIWSDKLYQYDIRSAYPAAMPLLPSLKGGMWVKATRLDRVTDFSLVFVECELPEDRPFYPFFWRSTDGRIIYPPSGSGWHWKCEVDAALAGEELEYGRMSKDQREDYDVLQRGIQVVYHTRQTSAVKY